MVRLLFVALRIFVCSTDGEKNVEGRELAAQIGCTFIEASAKQRINVDDAFTDLVREIRRFNKASQGRPPYTLSDAYPSNRNNKQADRRSWIAMQDFFKEIFA